MVEITAILIIEVAGFPKEHVEKVMGQIVDNIKKEKKVLNDHIHDIKEVKEMWSGFVDLEVKFDNLNEFTDFCFTYMPSSIDIIEPEEFNLMSNEMSNLFNDLMGNLHRYDMLLKNFKATNTLLKRKLEGKDSKNK